jgi:hypothetical protein
MGIPFLLLFLSVIPDVIQNVLQGFGNVFLVDPEIHFLADFFALQNPRLTQDLEVVRHGRAA